MNIASPPPFGRTGRGVRSARRPPESITSVIQAFNVVRDPGSEIDPGITGIMSGSTVDVKYKCHPHGGTPGEAWEEFKERFLNIATTTDETGCRLSDGRRSGFRRRPSVCWNGTT